MTGLESVDPDGKRRLKLTYEQTSRLEAMHAQGVSVKDALERLGIDRDKFDVISSARITYIDEPEGE